MLADRLRERRKKLKLTQKQLSKMVGVSHVTISQWESSDTSPNGENLYQLAAALKCDSSWLLKGGHPYEVNDTSSKYNLTTRNESSQSIHRHVPIISWLQASSWSDQNDHVLNQAEYWRDIASDVGENAFALKVKGDSMTNPYGSPSIPAGSIVIIDPSVEPINGSIVVAKLANSQEATLKKLVIDGADRLLKPLNPEFKTTNIGSETHIIGVAIKVEMDL